jgi:hyperosmotically inducible protein
LPQKVSIWRGGGQRVQKDFAESFVTCSRKGLAMTPFGTNLQKGLTAMKKRDIIIHCLVLLMLIATLAACASTPTRESTGEYVDDSVITTKVKSLLANDDFFKSFHQISVETYKGVVQLSGFVNSQQAVDKAGQLARSVPGVKSVKNDLIVK